MTEEKTNIALKGAKKIHVLTSYLLLLLFVFLTVVVTYFLYLQVQAMFKSRLQERLIAIANTASVQFSDEELDLITGPESVGTDVYNKVIFKLQEIRNRNEDLKFIYILRKTDDPNIFTFIADADSLDPTAEIDLNQDGQIDESDALNTPGDLYDVSEFPSLKENAFNHYTVDEELAIDQWGAFLSASAPIFDAQGIADEMIGIDVEVSDFVQIINLALIPFILFVAFLLFVMTTQTVVLVRMWKSRVDLLKELDSQKDELLSIVSHQLAAPVTALKWYLELLLDEGKNFNEEQKNNMTSMQKITVDLSDLVSMILDVSRIQLGRMNTDPQPLDLDAFFKEILDVIQPKATEKNVKFIKELPEQLPTALLDKRLMRMTIENLLTNAVKYTPKGGEVCFSVKLKGDTMYCEVKDTGCGIPKAEQDKIFGKQFRASNVRNSIDGNGFGLYVAKGAIEGQGGKIWFTSEEGKGTTFYIELPIKKDCRNEN